jgi:HAE1 family hydrophobic/amphiphilic exporter-1
MSWLARLSLANRGLVALVALVITAFGAFAIPSLKQQLFPSLEFPAAFVAASYPGASPDIVEQQVTEPIEEAVQGLPGLSRVSSTTREGSATVQVEFEFGTNLTDSVNRLQTNLNRIDAQLPPNVDPFVFAGSTDDLPAIVLAASSTEDERTFAAKLDRSVLPELQGIDGVRDATVTGARELTVVITPDPATLAAAGADPTAIPALLRANGIATPAGTLTQGDTALTVQVGKPLASLDDLRNLYLAGPRPVRLGDIATVDQQLAAPTSLTRTNGKPSLGLSITAKPDGNAVEISHQVRERLPELTRMLGGDAALTVIFDQAPFIEKSIEGLTTEGLLGLLMAVLVILVFLLSVRSTLVTAVSIPLSVVVALLALWSGDLSLNLLTLGALTIAVGRVVDDSIVVLENIKRHLGYGEARRDAIISAVREVAGAVTASTLTTVAVFAPIALVGGFVGQLFAPFAITVTVALLASLLVSLTVIPVLAYWFLKPPKGTDPEAVRRQAEQREQRNLLQRAYLPVIRFATRRRLTTLLIGVIVFVGTIGLAGRLETNFIDQSGATTLSVTQEMPIGTNLAATDAAAKRVESIVAETAGVADYQVTVGGGGFLGFLGGGQSNEASFSITLDDNVDAQAVENDLRGKLAGLGGAGELTVAPGGGGPGGASADQLQVIVQAADPDVLRQASEQVRQAMADTPDVTEVTTDLATSAPRVEISVDRAAAARAGLTETQIGPVIGQVFRGSPLGQVTLDGRQQDVILRFGGAAPADVKAIGALRLPAPGGTVTVDSVADVSTVDAPVAISRIDGDRSARVTGKATGSNLGATTAALTTRLDDLTLPAGASYTIAGVSADQAEAFRDLGLALLAAIAIVFLIMAATFRSLAQPLILLVSIPFAATGAIGLLLATGTPLGVPALIGMLMLVGIVVTNAIVLMDLINQYREAGMSVQEAVIEGGRRRLRPILMTAVATIFALLPMAFGLTGDGGFISQPLAIVVIGGLISSTLLTLVLVPTLYTMVERRKERRAARRAARRGPTPPAPPAPTAEREEALV